MMTRRDGVPDALAFNLGELVSGPEPAGNSPAAWVDRNSKLALVVSAVLVVCGCYSAVEAIGRRDLSLGAQAGFYFALAMGALADNTSTSFTRRNGRIFRLGGGVVAVLGAIAAFSSGSGAFVIFLGVVNALIALGLFLSPLRRS